MTKKYGTVYISWIGTTPAWARSPDERPFSGHWETEEPTPEIVEEGPGWQTAEEAIAWGRERAPVVLVYLGSTEDEIYSAGERDVRGFPRWPPREWPRELDWDELDADDDDEGSTRFFLFLSEEAERRPVKEVYGVFRRPRNDADRRAGELARRLGALDLGVDEEDEIFDPEIERHRRPEHALGDVIEDEGRLVLTGLGGAEDMLYVAPTTNDNIAYAVLPNGGGGCGPPGPDGLILGALGWARTLSRSVSGTPRGAHSRS